MAGPLKKGKLPADVLDMESTAKASQYLRSAVAKLRDFLPLEKETKLWQTLEQIFQFIEPTEEFDFSMYQRPGFKQSMMKQQFQAAGKEISINRKIPAYNRAVATPIGQDEIIRPIISGTEKEIEMDVLNFINNKAMRTLVNDVRRTVMLNLDIPHHIVQIRAGKEVTPITVNEYLKTVNHAIMGGAVIQGQKTEIDPRITADGYCKVITGDPDVKSILDSRFLIDIDKNFHPSRAEKLNKVIGDTIFLVGRAPSVLANHAENWIGMQATIGFLNTYRMTSNSTIADLAMTTKKQQKILLGLNSNALGNIPFGFFADICQAESDLPAKPFIEIANESEDLSMQYLGSAVKCMGVIVPILTECFHYDLEVFGGLNHSNALLISTVTANVTEEFLGMVNSIIARYFTKILQTNKKLIDKKWGAIRWVIENIIILAMERMEKYFTLMEYLSGDQRTYILTNIGANIAALLTGSSVVGNWAYNYVAGHLIKEGWTRSGTAGFDMPAHIGFPASCALRLEEGGISELHGMNSPYLSMTPGNALAKVGIAYCAALGRGDPWVASPLVKVAFSDKSLSFNFKDPYDSLIKGIEEIEKGE
ncbi:MAG: hypothetical protein EAX96_03485 [Candidatus Lokiarchaeota archaeon]|nr:hypothetical protein [Candidatus Lokiarchaeota archaeon]